MYGFPRDGDRRAVDVREGQSLRLERRVRLQSIPFELDIWATIFGNVARGRGWCKELEVYHNPLASHPIPFELDRGATHWYRNRSEMLPIEWRWSVLLSVYNVRMKG